ncbi:MAG TPA: isoprenylcysteine carboxylmethyltransferase family protein [Polyangia bacterium]|jgi:protein-S-isoprenylcysteine O-methyltransferase Ste14|nr:isoprenylcysteine carboxylmethyltransferase family protein [Polyangia bacterium]
MKPGRHRPWTIASEGEFRHRMWFIGGIFGLGFACSWIDRQSAGQWLASCLAAAGLPSSGTLTRHVAYAVGAALVTAGAALRSWATAYLNADTMMDARLHTQRLVIVGPYRFVRNPLYLGNFLVAAGIGLWASRIGFVVLMTGLFIFVRRLIGREEAHLADEHGDAFRQFLTVPRLWPTWGPAPPTSTAAPRPRWAQAFAGESLMWAAAVASAAYAATFRPAAVAVAFALGAIVAGARLLVVSR